jgi:outer membrane protein assembly factor BamB
VHNQVGFQSSPAVVDGVVYTGCRDANLYALDAKTGAEKWKVYHDGSWVISSPAVADGKIYYGTSDSALYNVVDAATGKSQVKEQGNSFMFSSPAVAGDVVVIGVSNGSLEARDRASGKLLWEFQTEAAKQNLGWVLTAQHKSNNSLLFRVLWQDPITVAVERLFAVGAIFSSPLVANGAVYFGSTDGNLYAIE